MLHHKGIFLLQLAMISLMVTLNPGAGHAITEDADNARIQVSRYQWDPSGKSLLTPTDTALLRHMELYFQGQIHYFSRPLIIANTETGERYRSLVAHRAEGAVSLSMGLFERVDVALIQAFTLDQLGRFPGRKMGQTASAGLQDTTLVTHVGLLAREENLVGISARGVLTFPSGQTNAWMSHEAITAGLDILLDGQWGAWHTGARLGYQVLPANDIYGLVQDDHLSFAISAAWQPTEAWRTSVEFNMATLATAPFQNSSEVYGEYLAALGYKVLPELEFKAMLGLGALHGLGSPEYRVALGFGYSNDSLVDDDRDGLNNPQDTCPNDPEDIDGYEDEDGCPDPDNDGDGIVDSSDPCPGEPEDKDGFQDEDGCPDLDNDEDGVVDTEDQCLNEPEDKDSFEDTDGCPDLDNDGDEILDVDDQCTLAPEDMDEFEDEDGCPEPDNDKDGLLDADDKCPNEAEIINGNEDDDGCPDEGEETLVVEGDQIEVKLDKVVFFERGRARLQPKARAVLEQLAQLLKNHKEIKTLRILGHTDKLGSRKLNEKLAQRRADWMKHLLVKLGVPSGRIEALGKAWDQPRADNQSNRGRARNRRVEFQIIRLEKPGPNTQAKPKAHPLSKQ
ncbi:MAG: OmpA family protein [Deltaproteobacteria bacterium]|jgi:large repetitive protein|nr:OmpA family protein [Deltaproteobacteria bacterium]MBT6434433.1 OmpA family protein [Deltaproteobacteria bacterium]MBT6491293.1 OmpA family protein [Deltaproteobacteria bacterium]